MNNIQTSFSEIPIYQHYATHDKTQIMRAFEYAKKSHEGQKRKSGEPYIVHPIAVTEIVMHLNVIPEIVISALLHDVLEDTPINFEDIHHDFGFHIAKIVNTLSKSHKIQILDHDTDEERKLLHHQFLELIKDSKAAIIKVADRLNNIRTLDHLSKEKQVRISLETIKMYVPLAYEMGIFDISKELHNTAQQYLSEGEYEHAKALSQIYEKEIQSKGYHKDAIDKCVMEIL